MTKWTNRLRIALILTAHAGIHGNARAQTGLGSERSDIGNLGGDIRSVWTSPARMGRSEALATAATLGAAALTSRIDSAGYVWMRTHERTLAMRLLSPVREGTRFSPYEMGSGQYLLPFSGALYLAGRLSKSVNLRDAGVGCAAGHVASLGLRQVVFRSVKRGRPAVTASPFDISVPGTSDWSWESFYSGHISNSMACASFLAHRYSLGLAEPIPYVYSLAIGLGRLADAHHWASDMIVGGVVGFAVGKAIAERQLRRQAPSAAAASSVLPRTNWQVPVVQWSIVF